MDDQEYIYKVIVGTATAILDGVDPRQIVNDPCVILSGKTKQIVLSNITDGIYLGEEVLDILKEEFPDTDPNELFYDLPTFEKQTCIRTIAGKPILAAKYDNRENPFIMELVRRGCLRTFRLATVPVEDWAYKIKPPTYGLNCENIEKLF